MICIDCQKSYPGSGIRCIRCSDLFERGKVDKQQSFKEVVSSTSELKRCKSIINLTVGIATLNLIGVTVIWLTYVHFKVPCTNPPLFVLKDEIFPIGLLLQTLIIIGIALKKSRTAALLLLAGHCYQIVTISERLASRGIEQPIWPLIIAGIYLAGVYQCFKWHYLRKQLQKKV